MSRVYGPWLAALLWAPCALAQQHAQQHQHQHAPLPAQQQERLVEQRDAAAPLTAPAVEPDASQREHVPPAAPGTSPSPQTHAQMVRTMGMDDTAPFRRVLFDEAEVRDGGEAGWDAQVWYGGDYHRLWLESEGARERGDTHGRTELLWSRLAGRWWSTRLGLRRDFGEGSARTWLAAGVEGLAPWHGEVEATAYASEGGRTAARLAAALDLLLTQRLILRPDVELEAFGRSDARAARGSGLARTGLGLRLRYELRREFAPYIGADWTLLAGRTRTLARAAGEPGDELRLVAGLRWWF